MSHFSIAAVSHLTPSPFTFQAMMYLFFLTAKDILPPTEFLQDYLKMLLQLWVKKVEKAARMC